MNTEQQKTMLNYIKMVNRQILEVYDTELIVDLIDEVNAAVDLQLDILEDTEDF